jgi:hypothetical protein
MGLYVVIAQLTTPLSRHNVSLEPMSMLMVWAYPSVHSSVPHMHLLRGEHSLQLGIRYGPAHRRCKSPVDMAHFAWESQHNAPRKQSMMHSSIYAMDTRTLLDLITMIHHPAATPLLVGGDRREPKSLVSWYGLLRVVAESNHTHCHCSTAVMLSAYKVYPVSSMLPSLMAWFSRKVSNAARSAASACRTSQLFIEALASSSGWVRSRTRCRRSWL